MAARITGTFILQVSMEGTKENVTELRRNIVAKCVSEMCVATVKAMLNV